MRLRIRLALATLLVASGCAPKPTAPPGNDIARWLRLELAIVRAERVNPPLATRIAAYTAVALHEGLASDPALQLPSLAGRLNGLAALPTATDAVDGGVVSAEAARTVLGELVREGFPTTRRAVDSLAAELIRAREAAGVDAARRDRSVAHGQAVGAAIIAWAATDSFAATRGRPYALPPGRGVWVNTSTPNQHLPEALSAASDVVLEKNAAVSVDPSRAGTRELFMNRPKPASPNTTLGALNPAKPTEPYWGRLRPFVLSSPTACPIVPPPDYDETPGSPFWAMAKVVVDTTAGLTPEQRTIALFWADNAAMTGTPAFHWMSVLSQMIGTRGLSAAASARLYVELATGIADAFIAGWYEKYRSLTVRPVTYIQRVFDPGYQTLVITPPFPEYPSGHSTQSGAAARILSRALGDTVPFADSTQMDIGYAPRTFRNFSHARDEVAISRLYGGIHYLPAIVEGVKMGECIADSVAARLGTRP
ncbi:MAG: vanadium-dependent haloperoxidase [Gemmatimonadaceae bacterium]|nr:vanadium-dependent haloperoxidase [Gemmatimonadaceae bacterium]